MRKIQIKMFLLGMFVCSAVFGLKGDPDAGKGKMGSCVECHNEDGNSTTPLWPKISQFSEAYLYKQLTDFKAGESGGRNVPLMYSQLQNFSEEDLADLAAYFAVQKRTIDDISADQYELGRMIYRGGNPVTGLSACAACHGANGQGNALAQFPRLSGQNAEYVAQELEHFKNEERSNDINGMMRSIAKKMTPEEIKAVSSYVSGLY